MQYRLIIHGDIDTFLKLRKRLKSKMPMNYLGSNQSDRLTKDDGKDESPTPIHLGTTFLS
jgi:hypothetical protein